jgi:hypothetical protein
VGKERRLLLLAHRCDVDVVGWMKTHCLRAEIHLVVVQLEATPGGEPGPEGQRTGGLMVEVPIDGPFPADRVRPRSA